MATDIENERLAGTPGERWMTPRDICDELQIPEQTFYQWRARHLAPRAYRIGRHLRIRRADFNAWLAERSDTSD